MSKQLIAYATIKNKDTDWEEDFEVDSEKAAKSLIKKLITDYNDTLRPGELKRTFVKINRFEEKEINEFVNRDFSDEFEDEDDFDEYDESYDDRYYD